MEDNNNSPRRTGSYRRAKQPKESGGFVDMITMQASVCVIILLGVICVRYIDTNTTNNLQDKLKVAISNEITVEDLKMSLKTGEESIQTFRQSVQTIFGRESEANNEATDGILENIPPKQDEIATQAEQSTEQQSEQQTEQPTSQTSEQNEKNTEHSETTVEQEQTTEAAQPEEQQQTTQQATQEVTQEVTQEATQEVTEEETIQNDGSIDSEVLKNINDDIENVEKKY